MTATPSAPAQPATRSVRLRRPALALSALALGAVLAGCAAPRATPADSAQGTVAGTVQGTQAPLITVPPANVGTWVDLGHFNAPWLAGDSPVPVTGPNAPTRVAGWRRDDGQWLAIVVVQTAASAPGMAHCPLAMNQEVVPGPDGHCLRMRRDADFDGWMQRQNAVMYQWLDSRGWSLRPRSWVSYRVPAENGPALEAHALFDMALIEPVTRNPNDFLLAGAPATQWARQFAAAARAAGGSGRLAVPQFPYGPRIGLPPPPPAVKAPPPARATQVTPPAPVPRVDRE
ncbi:hypothetical protein FVQ98_03490 [Ottowia sp. GY511]|uniref:Uncharacterized protein n=1 Tax=Ottowia flava TaxID=2675430 RepID=A0ABW4KQD3_9BURK|nr:hypothetical protein [Ottowia sp. GY511]TXK33059.1 hypothetical protein FVQ98_03490 [Ottowia sp. GY511]